MPERNAREFVHPRPWRAEGDRIIALEHPEEPESGAVIFKSAAIVDNIGAGAANAAFIVVAVNEYDELRQLERCIRHISVPDGRYRMIARRALKALDKMRGELAGV